jgi:HEAT repeat protein
LLALGKCARDPAALEVLLAHAGDRSASPLVRESAALAVGLARRTDETRRMDGLRLDLARRDLLALTDDADAPTRARAFAALAVGLLGDQPYAGPATRDGRVAAREVWSRLERPHADATHSAALLTALGLLPREGVAPEVHHELRRLIAGARVAGRRWDAHERSHALAAVVRQRGAGWFPLLVRVLEAKRTADPVRRAGLLALGGAGPHLALAERLEAVRAAERVLDLAHDPFTRGLALLARGRLVAADLADGSLAALCDGGTEDALLRAARNAAPSARGFAALALGFSAAAAAARDEMRARAFVASARDELLALFGREGDPVVRGAYAVALGLLVAGGGSDEGVADALAGVVVDRNADARLRGHACIALASAAPDAERAAEAIGGALEERASPGLASEAAVALSLLGGRPETRRLLRALSGSPSERATAQIVIALGRLGDPSAAAALLTVARERGRSEETRALAVTALGLLVDPEPRPSLHRLSLDANYPARTDALQEAFTLF